VASRKSKLDRRERTLVRVQRLMTENPSEFRPDPASDASGDACSHSLGAESDQSGPVRSAKTPARRSQRPRINFYLDVTTTLILAALIGTGILLEWVLPPGVRGGRGLTWLGEHRHFWGDVHFWLAASMIGLVVAHLALHATWIAQCWKRMLGSLRSPLTWGVIVVALGAIVTPLIVPVERGTNGFHRGRGLEAMERGESRSRGRASDGIEGSAVGRSADGSGRGWRGGRRGRQSTRIHD
jgi:hypothetical protein